MKQKASKHSGGHAAKSQSRAAGTTAWMALNLRRCCYLCRTCAKTRVGTTTWNLGSQMRHGWTTPKVQTFLSSCVLERVPLCYIWEWRFQCFSVNLEFGQSKFMYMSIHEFKISVAAYCSRSSFFPHPYPRTTRTWTWTNRISDDRPNVYDSWTRLERIWERMGPAFVFRNQVRICSYHWNVLSQSTWTYLNPFNDIEAFFTTRVCIPQCVLTFPVGAPWSAFLRLAHFSLELCGLVCCLLSMMIRHAQHRRKSNLSLWGPVSAGLLDWNGLNMIQQNYI